jgi:hypothetical protein
MRFSIAKKIVDSLKSQTLFFKQESKLKHNQRDRLNTSSNQKRYKWKYKKANKKY